MNRKNTYGSGKVDIKLSTPVVDELVDGPEKIAGAFAIAVVQLLGPAS